MAVFEPEALLDCALQDYMYVLVQSFFSFDGCSLKPRNPIHLVLLLAVALVIWLGVAQAESTEEPNAADTDTALTAEGIEALTTENRELRRKVKRLEAQIAGDTAIDADNRELRYEMIRLRTERARLRQENDELKSLRFRIKWGGSLFLLGIVMGYIVALRRARRRFESEMGKL